MARKIELEFYDKKYTIEYNRASVKEVLLANDKDQLGQVVALIKAGLLIHHKDEMPTDDEIFGWVMAMGEEVKQFAEALQEMIQEVVSTFENDRKNLKWRKA